MATVALANVYNPLTFARREQEAQLQLNRFIQSGVAEMDEQITAQASAGGNIGELPFYKALGTTEPNYSTDNPATNSTPLGLTNGKMIWRSASQNQSWSVMDLSRELALEDPVGAITGRIGQYWATQNEKRVIQSCLGVLADNVANDSGDMLYKVGNDANSAVTDAERINADSVLTAKQTMGDHAGSLSTIAMHSALYTRLQKQNLIDFVPASDGKTMIPTYLGYTVVVDDSMPAVAGTYRILYTVALFGRGLFRMGTGKTEVPSERLRKPDAGNGGGEERLYSRRCDIIHPYGFSFVSGSVAGQSATQAELATASNWDRTHQRKNIPLAFLQVND